MKLETFESFESKFGLVAKKFAAKHLVGFNNRKPKKIISHTNAVLRNYRDKNLDTFEMLVGTIIVWRYAMMARSLCRIKSQLPRRIKLRLEQSIVRSFNYILLRLTDDSQDNKDMLEYLKKQTPPKRSVMSEGNPLGKVLELKSFELDIKSGKLSAKELNYLENEWKVLQDEIKFCYRVQIPIPN